MRRALALIPCRRDHRGRFGHGPSPFTLLRGNEVAMHTLERCPPNLTTCLNDMTGEQALHQSFGGAPSFVCRLGACVHAFSTRWRYRPIHRDIPVPSLAYLRPRNPAAGPFVSVDRSQAAGGNAFLIDRVSVTDRRSPDAIFVSPSRYFCCGPCLAARVCSDREPHMTRRKSLTSMLGAAMDAVALGVAMVAMVLLVGRWLVLPQRGTNAKFTSGVHSTGYPLSR